MSRFEPTQKEALSDLFGRSCSGCGLTKRADQSFCYRCYKKLPKRLQRALYQRIGDGYESALGESRRVLAGRGNLREVPS